MAAILGLVRTFYPEVALEFDIRYNQDSHG